MRRNQIEYVARLQGRRSKEEFLCQNFFRRLQQDFAAAKVERFARGDAGDASGDHEVDVALREDKPT